LADCGYCGATNRITGRLGALVDRFHMRDWEGGQPTLHWWAWLFPAFFIAMVIFVASNVVSSSRQHDVRAQEMKDSHEKAVEEMRERHERGVRSMKSGQSAPIILPLGGVHGLNGRNIEVRTAPGIPGRVLRPSKSTAVPTQPDVP
jgi:hypothetical protein